ncbi:MAG: hypothetical protein QOI38_3148 [Sphingomonadales bacterium]|jgi:hypothetical protein|nr:hypothetical protein [Sphingomonadales bacterium]
MRRPLLLAAAIALTGGSIGLIALSERRPAPVLESRMQVRAMDAPLPSVPMPANAPRPSPPAPPPPPQERLVLRDVEGEPGERPGGIIREAAPRIAYSYAYRFRVPAAALAGVQERHLQLCLELGELRCRVVSMRRSETRPATVDHGYGGGAPVEQPGAALELQVATPLAHQFGRSLGAAAGAAGGETVDRQIAAEDLSRQMVDFEARIRTRETLIRRLSALLETRSGNIQQAVEAERAINEAQEELDAARTWLAEMRGRVTMSRIAIAYEAGPAATAGTERSPFASSLAQIAALTRHSFAALLLVFGVLLPWGAIVLLVVLAARWGRRRLAASQPS